MPVYRGAPPISRYTRVLRAAHGRVKSTLHSRFGSLQLYMNCGSRYIIVFACFVLIRVKFIPSQHSTGERESSTLTHWAVFFTGHLTTETIVSFALRSLYHQNGFDPSSINCCSSVKCYDGYICRCPNTLLKRVLHVLRNTFSTVPAHLSAPLQGLSRSKLPIEVKTVCFTYPLHNILVSAG